MLKVLVDSHLNSVFCGGVSISGLHASVAPRRQTERDAVLEKYKFVPYLRSIEHSNDVSSDYVTQCEQVLHAGLTEWLGNGLNLSETVKNQLRVCLDNIELQNEEEDEGITFQTEEDENKKKGPTFEFLERVFNLKHDSHFNTALESLAKEYRSKVQNDLNFSSSFQEDIAALKSLAAVCTQNSVKTQVKIVEFNGANLAKNFANIFNSEPQLNVESFSVETMETTEVNDSDVTSIKWGNQSVSEDT